MKHIATLFLIIMLASVSHAQDSKPASARPKAEKAKAGSTPRDRDSDENLPKIEASPAGVKPPPKSQPVAAPHSKTNTAKAPGTTTEPEQKPKPKVVVDPKIK